MELLRALPHGVKKRLSKSPPTEGVGGGGFGWVGAQSLKSKHLTKLRGEGEGKGVCVCVPGEGVSGEWESS